MNYFKQIYYEMKHQKMMTWVSVGGTALAIFLVMALIMSESIYDVAVTPESNRDRILFGQGIHIKTGDNGDGSTMTMTYDMAKKLYSNLKGIEQISYTGDGWNSVATLAAPGKPTMSGSKITADANIWKIFDYRFIDGRPFNADEANSQARVAVITRSTARKLFSEDKVAGRQIDIDSYPYTIVGVIEDPNPLLTNSYVNIIRPYNPALSKSSEPWFGEVAVLLLAKEGADINNIKSEVKQRYDRIGIELQKEGKDIYYHEQPYTSREMSISFFGSNNSPDVETHDTINIIILAILILLPAINLSSMTRSRLRHRVSEIGVRRVFGAKKTSIISQIFTENLIITLIGGIIGLVLSLIFLRFFSSFLFQFNNSLGLSSPDSLNANPDFSMLFRWENFFGALVLCFVLNILSATVPAWKASKVQPAVALSGSR